MNLQALNYTGTPLAQGTATYSQSDSTRMIEGWHVFTYCTMPNTVALLEPEADTEQEELFGPRVIMLRPTYEASLLRDALTQLDNYQPGSDVPRPADIGQRKGRFAE